MIHLPSKHEIEHVMFPQDALVDAVRETVDAMHLQAGKGRCNAIAASSARATRTKPDTSIVPAARFDATLQRKPTAGRTKNARFGNDAESPQEGICQLFHTSE